MWYFRFYPIWQFEKIEKFLEDMEKKGYQLEDVKHYYFFKFKKSSSKNVQYLFYYVFMKDFNLQHFNIQQQIKSEFLGNVISLEPNVYRICDTTIDLSHIKKFRKHYLRTVLLKKMVLSLIFILPSIALVFFQKGIEISFIEIIYLIMGSISLLFLVYYLIGIFSLR